LNNQFRSLSSSLDEQNLYWFTISLFSTREIFPDLIAIQSEIVYTRGGKNWEGDAEGTDYSFDIYADYLQMPWLLKISLPIMLRPRIYAGPHLSWMFRSRVERVPVALEDAPFFTGKDPQNNIYEGNVNVLDIGLTTGLDFDFPAGPGSFVFDFRYTLGGLNIFNYAEGDNIKNYAFLFMAGYSLNFGGF
jgi:hypothetical protein